jgi:hypothetical protein
MGFCGPGSWAGADLGRGEMGRAFGLGQFDRIGFFYFSKINFQCATIPERSSNCFKAPKILEKFQKFQENSQK